MCIYKPGRHSNNAVRAINIISMPGVLLLLQVIRPNPTDKRQAQAQGRKVETHVQPKHVKLKPLLCPQGHSRYAQHRNL